MLRLVHNQSLLLLRRIFKYRNRILRVLTIVSCLLVASLAITLLWAFIVPAVYTRAPAHYLEFESQLERQWRLWNGPNNFQASIHQGNPQGQKIFIASNIIQHDLIRGQWGQNLRMLLDYLGPENVFVSIYENDSGPGAGKALASLRDQLSCNYSITFGDHISVNAMDFPTVVTPDGDMHVKRMTYLAEIRNRLLRPLDNPDLNTNQDVNYTSVKFDKILFLNDIYYNPVDALHLIFNTNNGEYDIACAVNYFTAVKIYDTFVLRDIDGYEVGSTIWPWFTTKGSAQSLEAARAGSDAIPVKACYNGMAAYKAQEFLNQDVSNTTIQPPLRFRAQEDLFWEESECCLLAADYAERVRDARIYLNPYVRVAYTPRTWSRVREVWHLQTMFPSLSWCVTKLGIGYRDNPRREDVAGSVVNHRVWRFDREGLNGEIRGRRQSYVDELKKEGDLSRKWVDIEKVANPGGFCGQKKLFVLVPDFETRNQQVSGEAGGKNWLEIKPPH